MKLWTVGVYCTGIFSIGEKLNSEKIILRKTFILIKMQRIK